MKKFVLAALLACVAVPTCTLAQKYPEKSIRLVVAFPTGAPYVIALMVADKLRDPLGQSVVPDFKGFHADHAAGHGAQRNGRASVGAGEIAE